MTLSTIKWSEADTPCCAHWFSNAGVAPPLRVIIADERMTADAAFRLASEGTSMLWRGDFQNGRQLLQAMTRRVDRSEKKQREARSSTQVCQPMPAAFNAYRQGRAQRARTLGRLLVPINAGYVIDLRRAPDVKAACIAAYGPLPDSLPDGRGTGAQNVDTVSTVAVVSLRELQGTIGAYEWRKKGVAIEALGRRIHPHYGVFAPIRSEYIALVANATLPVVDIAFDIGTGTGVLAAVLARRGVKRIVATDVDEKALACARDNLLRLDCLDQVEVVHADLFPPGQAGLIVCNPPWIPARPSSPLEHAVYDHESRMLRGFLNGLSTHLLANGEAWLILSDLAEHLGLRSRESLLAIIKTAGLTVLGRADASPHHRRTTDDTDTLHAARRLEVTSLWRLGLA